MALGLFFGWYEVALTLNLVPLHEGQKWWGGNSFIQTFTVRTHTEKQNISAAYFLRLWGMNVVIFCTNYLSVDIRRCRYWKKETQKSGFLKKITSGLIPQYDILTTLPHFSYWCHRKASKIGKLRYWIQARILKISTNFTWRILLFTAKVVSDYWTKCSHLFYTLQVRSKLKPHTKILKMTKMVSQVSIL